MAPTFEIHPVVAEDMYEIFSVGEKAFSALNPILFHTLPLSTASKELISTSRAESFGKDPRTRAFKAVDAESGKVIGFAQWAVQNEDEVIEKTIEEEVADRLAHDIPERRRDSSIAYYTTICTGKREIIGIPDLNDGQVKTLKKRVELSSLFVHPGFQGRGIAKEFLKWGLQEAERLGLPMYLEATRAGRPLYEKVGFEALKEVTFDARLFGVDIVDCFTFMVRPVNASS